MENQNFIFAVVKMYSNYPKRNTEDIEWKIWRVSATTAKCEQFTIFDQKQPFGT